ncbi:zinc metallopeptidase [Porphyromonas cangingivalis]|uniref:Membrane protein n=1 Tax=Porphyromonas cangingivalis TaxID=36874 RepID=A0A099WYQ7_PORCN|nr:zinc metallopeptidase [Porphyromonas cangingivalis]KGL49816.1 membrane protein [Porphyromonas cangingivalis]KGN78756.1 membrane protein [Porphyromonas cangingivalis]SPY35124.1 Putative neutral zinc metallopeptidase [Porphyromonas cangingivalis]
MINIWWLMLIVPIIGAIVSMRLQAKFKKYSAVPLASGMTGKEIAEKMLADSGITDVRVISTNGMLTDHYNPANKTINLSEGVYAVNSVAAAAVAAHETGHAIQHARAYAPLQMRSALVPIVSFASNIVNWVLLAGIVLVNSFPSLLLIGIILFAMTTLFSFVTLPVEIDASKRALVWLKQAGVTSPQQQPMAFDALKSAAYTYVVAALGSLVTLLYYVSVFLGRRD